MSKCTGNKIDALLSSSSTVDDIISKGITKVTLEDYCGDTPPSDIFGDEEDMNSRKKFTSCEQKLEHTKTHEISHYSASSNADTTDIVSGDVVSDAEVFICANCGKEGASNTCNKCKLVKYCNAACKKKHKTKHKKACERHVAELHDIELFKDPPPLDDCPIFFIRLPLLGTGRRYNTCCGKIICSGCIYAVAKRDEDALCPFCRNPTPVEEEIIKLTQKRADVGDAEAIFSLGCYYYDGTDVFPQDYSKALELWEQAAELGDSSAYCDIGNAYLYGNGVESNKKKAVHYYELGAMRGDASSRHNLDVFAEREGITDRALRHYMIAVDHGHNRAVKNMQELCSKGKATQDEYTKGLRAYQMYLVEIRSAQRDEAAAFYDLYKYIE